jgi:hypothetical protein
MKKGLKFICSNEFDLKLYGRIAIVYDNIEALELFKAYDIKVLPGFINLYMLTWTLAARLECPAEMGYFYND